ncbi:MAG: hypothetical protein JJU27_15965 [Gammaproteobacteria bacterium]|nr:hypothetical protein [Gammaproteobacteria bacterium]
MQVETAWVKPPPQIGGLDHLAVQAPCINIYGRMLPGITNVTDRARYYSFYPWLMWAFDQRGYTRFDDDFIERFRRADCLFCLIAHRHADVSKTDAEDHAGALVGSDTLREVAQTIQAHDTVRLSDYSLRVGAKKRYFANDMGGLGQYYLGVLRELAILDGDGRNGIRYTKQIGQVIAARMDQGIDRELFLEVVEADRVSAAELDALHGFCPCQLVQCSEERKILEELFFVRGPFYDLEALPRRRTLQSIMQLAGLLAEDGKEISEDLFRACAYAGGLSSNRPWTVPVSLAGNRERWAVYARNELLSIAVQGLFHSVLSAYSESGLRLDTSPQIVDWFMGEDDVCAALAELGAGQTFAAAVSAATDWIPELTNWGNDVHEVQLTNKITKLTRASKSAGNCRKIIAASLRTLVALAARQGNRESVYADLVFDPNYFSYYPINLQSFSFHGAETWRSLTMSELLRWLLVNWGLETHLRVALRKLRGQSTSTFRIRPTDRGMEVIDIPPAVHTRPRFYQALRVLKDVGALERTPAGLWQPSSFGTAMLELGDAP